MMLIVGQDRRDRIEFNVIGWLYAAAFSVNGECIWSGGQDGLQEWRVEDREQMATVEAPRVRCHTVSRDGRWITAGTFWGYVHVWDAKTCEQVFVHKEDLDQINGVDFSPDSTRVVSASENHTAAVWDIATREKVHTLRHEDDVFAAKYSPQGDRIATATRRCVRVYDSNDGRLLVDIKVEVAQSYNTALLWYYNDLLVVSGTGIKQFESSTGSTVSEWPMPSTRRPQCIAIPNHGKFIAYSSKGTVTFWDTLTHTQLGLIEHPQDIYSIAFSPDDQLIGIGGENGKIIIESPPVPLPIAVSGVSCWIRHISTILLPNPVCALC